jgi:pimeloyl-ACP methyl ester carboxylesterase
MESLVYDGCFWKFRFSYEEIFESEKLLAGNYWDEWERIRIPILLIHGKKTWACKTENLIEMEHRNKNSRLICYENAGHSVHDDARDEFTKDLIRFVEEKTDI